MDFGGECMLSALAGRLRKGARLLAADPALFLRLVCGRLERYVVYSLSPAGAAAPADPGSEYDFRLLSGAELRDLCSLGPDFQNYRERLEIFGCSNVYALYWRGELAHLASLVTSRQDARLPLRLIRLREGEAEIAVCLTMPAFRGRGLYPYVIRRLCRIAAQEGIERVLMTTMTGNTASRRGIEKAGFRLCGFTWRFVPPLFPWSPGLLYRRRRTAS
jgi:GNAT superfamily N-acetyltransferase